MAEAPTSRLPDDPEYWDRLARRIREDASAPLAMYASDQDTWWALLARRAPWLVAGSVAAMFLLWLFMPAPSSSVAFHWMERSLMPDEIAGTLMSGPVPPSVHELMAQFPPAEENAEEPRR